jgi:fermentation-respiration switch protein FrsA (DUF1100 family)
MWIYFKFAFISYAVLTGVIFLFQRHLMYHPVRAIQKPEAYGLRDVHEVFIKSADGTTLQIWQHMAKNSYPTILYFHGNAGNLLDRAPKFGMFVENGFGLIAVSYRGYGKSGGFPTEAGIYDDARATIDYATHTLAIPQEKLVYFGESLGSGVAVQMASERKPGLLMLEAAYTSVETRSAELYPFLFGVRHLVLDKYDSLSKIKNVHCPLVMLHGEKDSIIPTMHGRTLFAAANEPKNLVLYKEVDHTDYTNEQILLPLIDAAKKAGLL